MPGEMLFPDVRYNRLMKIIKTLAIALGVPNGHRAGSHGFRRGATQDMQDRGFSLTQQMNSGGWKSDAVNKYRQIPLIVDKAISTVPVPGKRHLPFALDDLPVSKK